MISLRPAVALGLCLWSLPAAARPATPPAPRAAEDPFWVVAVRPEGRAEALAVDGLSAELLSGAEALWVGSARQPPRRLTPPFPDPADLLDRSKPPEPALLQVSVTVPDAEDRSRRGTLGRVMAAPVAMWQEVPEDLIPSWSLPTRGALEIPGTPGETWRLRHVSPGAGSWWTDVPAGRRAVRLAAWKAEDVRTTVVGPEGEPVQEATASVLEASERHRRPRFLARFAGDPQGRFAVPSLPDLEPASFVLGAPGHSARAWSGVPSALPERWRLPLGRTLSGRVVDGDDRPLAGVEVAVEAWLEDDADALFRRSTTTGDDGAWSLDALPRREMALRASKDGFVPHRERISADAAGGARSAIVLHPGASLELEVVDGDGAPVAGARVSGRELATASTDADGMATLAGVPAGGRLRLEVEAEGFVPAQAEIPPPLPSSYRVALERAFNLLGRFLDPAGSPVEEGMAVVNAEGCPERRHELLPGGRFDLQVDPDTPLRLALLSPATRRLEVSVEPGFPGEVRDLGDVQAPPGLTVTGRVTSAADGLPLPGARVWVPRPSADGPALAWMHGDLVETRTAEDGAFVLTGLPPGPAALRAEAPGHARAHRSYSPEEGAFELDVGEVELSAGGRVRVVLSGADAREPAVAVLDLQGTGNPADELTARVEEGVGEIGPAPPGEAVLSVRRGPRLLCRRQVAVPEGDTVEAACEGGPLVTGQVWAGNHPADGGTLEWSTPALETMPKGIYNQVSPEGLRRQQTFGPRPDLLTVEIQADGTFATDRLLPGTWSVVWIPEGGLRAEPRSVEVPEAEGYDVALHYSETVVAGVVLDPEGRALARAAVHDLESGARALTDEAGTYRLTLSPGTHRLQARWRELTSPVVGVRVEAGTPVDPIDLVVAEPAPGLTIAAFTEAGSPASGAFVFVEVDSGVQRLFTADAAGRAVVKLPPPKPEAVRLAVFHEGRWALTGWRSAPDASEEVEVTVAESGSLVLLAAETGGLVRIAAPHGWDLTRLLSAVGHRPVVEPDGPLVLNGLPAGVYRVALEHIERTATVKPGESERLELE